MIGLRTIYQVAADVPFASSTALATVGLTSPIAANQTQKIRAWVPITTGATGGVKVQMVVPAGGTAFLATITINDTVTPAVTPYAQTASAAQGNALAAAGTHWVLVECTVINGATAGNIDLQFAQNSAANTTTILKGGIMEVVKY